MARRSAVKKLEPFNEARDVLELIARFLVGGSYRVPVEGPAATRETLRTSDIAAAVGYMGNRLERQTALAVATRVDEAEIARLSQHAYRAVMRAARALRPAPLDLHKAADRWRLRMIVYDAAFELVWPERRRPYGLLARDTKMRKATYIQVHRCATATLQDALNSGREDFHKRLFALWADS